MAPSVLTRARADVRPGRGGEERPRAEDRAIVLTGFESAEEAERAAGAAYDALRAWAARQRRAITDYLGGRQ